MTFQFRHCEERGDEAIQIEEGAAPTMDDPLLESMSPAELRRAMRTLGYDTAAALIEPPRHCERSEAIQNLAPAGLLRRFTPRNDVGRT